MMGLLNEQVPIDFIQRSLNPYKDSVGYLTLKDGVVNGVYPIGEYDQDIHDVLQQRSKEGSRYNGFLWVSDEKFLDNRWIGMTQNDIEKILSGEKIDPQKMGNYNPDGVYNLNDSKVKNIVYRSGDIIHNPNQGGIWFSETKIGSENFMMGMYGKKVEAIPYHIILKNPKYLKNFWHTYLPNVESINRKGEKTGQSREKYSSQLMKQGYDGIVIGHDMWNDTGDEYAVESMQYVVFDPSNVFPVKSDN
jgi:hypothetical protein